MSRAKKTGEVASKQSAKKKATKKKAAKKPTRARARAAREQAERAGRSAEAEAASDGSVGGESEDAPGGRDWSSSDTLETRAERDPVLAEIVAKPWTKRVGLIEGMIDELRAHPSGADLRVLVERLLALAEDEKWEVRRAIANGLVHVEHPLFEKLAERLENDANQYVAQAARRAADRRRELDREYQRKTDEIDVVASELQTLRETHGEVVAAAAEKLAEHRYKLLTNETTHEMRTVVAGLLDALNKLHAKLEGSRTPKKHYERNLGIARDWRAFELMLEDTKKLVDDPSYDSEDVDLGELVEKVIELVEDALDVPAGVRVVAELDTRPGTKLHVPRSRLTQALSSLVKNAIEACEDEGTVAIRTAMARRGMVRVDIVDTGYGMAPEEIQRALLPLVSTKKDDQHTGVGLPLARKIIERECRGDFEITSMPDEGTTARCVLPLGQDDGF
ncbi:putative two-component sensor histidine kinase [Plesiocystis pacifica SIR-1]|uniref:histidine kinase n=1 Tax=Plesiocystis pacifica SIR-1 TaxID=391625 RepID=A6G6H8_9BACT|nr:HAMP domain-containing sensor histidine kinase [Plesiocystis pacifica]EDM78455.1 putative two-component sensor histidine kinase [Plesiocystis pacifica SIR-1]